MALSFPLPLADFADTIGAQQVKWTLQDNRQYSGMGSGQILQADLAPSLWVADVSLRPWRANASRRIEALINAVVQRQGSFYLTDPRKCVPTLDPGGATFGDSEAKIASLPDAKSMTLKGLPSGYKLSAGDYLSFDYGSPARRAFHEICEDVTANGSGVTAAFEVNPIIRTGAAVDDVVTLVKPAMKCIIRPGTMDVSYASGFTSIGFSAVQKL